MMFKSSIRKSALLAFMILLLHSLVLTSFFSHVQIVFAIPADSYGNDIDYVTVYQWNGSAWVLMANFTSSGGSARIHDSWAVKFDVGIQFNDTLASSDSEAVDYTKVLMNITKIGDGSIWTNVELNNTSVSSSGGFYWLIEEGNWTSDLAEAGATYSCTVDYQAYY